MPYRKYRNQPVYLHKQSGIITEIKPEYRLEEWLRFDSKLELSTFQSLPSESTYLQVKIPLKQKTLNTPGITYVADFAVTLNGQIYLFEAKGKLTDSAKLKLNLLDMVYPEMFANLFMVTYRKADIDEFPAWLRAKAITGNKLPKLIQRLSNHGQNLSPEADSPTA